VVWVALGLGSNHQSEANLHSALDDLLLQFNDIALSPVFRSAARDHNGADYLNMVVGIETTVPLQELVKILKKIEDKHRRDRSSPRPVRITLDIDVLLYGDKCGSFDRIVLPRPDITQASYVLWPLAQLAPNKRHPVLKERYAELWEGYDKSADIIAPVDFTWHDRQISAKLK
jgi:2-amino-4-hydroxy-6-hydroxymethyldihydropteridine diphosphokinase